MTQLIDLLEEVRACRLCEPHLPLGPRPVVQAGEGARLLIVGQAPGTRVHETGIPWNDPSGERLRDWLQIGPETFYDESGRDRPYGAVLSGPGQGWGPAAATGMCAPVAWPFAGGVAQSAADIVGRTVRPTLLPAEARQNTHRQCAAFCPGAGPGFFPLPIPAPAIACGCASGPGSRKRWCRC